MTLSIVMLTIASCIPILATIVFYELERKPFFSNKSYAFKQICIGVIFGLIAILGTEWGIKINGVVVNCRDAAPVAAGLIFGGPAGIIAGLMGGIERWFAVYWGVGSFTRVACSFSTCVAGFYAAFLRKFLFENKKPSWGLALGAGAIMEVFHLYMVFVTNIADATKAISVVHTCFFPMVIANSLSVMCCVLAVTIMAKEFKFTRIKRRGNTPIFETIQRWLLIVLAISFVVSISFIFTAQNNMSKNDTKRLLVSTIEETSNDVSDMADTHMLQTARLVAKEVLQGNHDVNKLASRYELSDVILVDKNGFIFETNNPDYMNFDMSSGEQSAEFLCLLDGEKQFVQKFGATSYDANDLKKYAGIATNFGFIQISYDAAMLQNKLRTELLSIANNKTIGSDGGVVILDMSNNIISHSATIDADMLFSETTDLSNIEPNGEVVSVMLGEEEYFACCDTIGGFYIISLYSQEEAIFSRDVSLYLSGFSILLIFAVMYILLYLLIKNIVVKQIVQMAQSLSNISSGHLDEVINVRSSKEFSSLSDDINSTVDTLKNLIDEAAARIDDELRYAKEIQFSSLPGPWRDESGDKKFEVFATIDTAKEVGGDFYDYYMSSPTSFNFLVADVSGKGIPAAMFMMKAKSVLRSFAERDIPVNEVFINANETLCEGNEADMFVTAWQGKLDITTGEVKFANAGHNPPVIRHVDGTCEYLTGKPSLVLAGMEGVKYKMYDFKLQPGEIIYLYTDGITEATNKDNELYGEDRLLNIMNNCQFETLEELLALIRKDIDAFVKDAPQFDDMTMLALKYL